MDEQEIRARVEKRIKARNEFLVHAMIYVIVMGGLWTMWLLSGDFGDDEFAWPIMPTLGWGAGVLAHGLGVYFNSPARLDARERLIRREVERERQRLENSGYQVTDKRKRDALYRLSDDGELIEVTDDEVEVKYKRED